MAISACLNQAPELQCTLSISAGNDAKTACVSAIIFFDSEDGRREHIAMYVVTAGTCVRERSEELKKAGEFVKAHGIRALGIETAEGAAEWLHRRIREDWGFPDPPTMTMQEHSHRDTAANGTVSAALHARIWTISSHLDVAAPDEIGVHPTEEMMMEPEASVSVLVLHNPNYAYFAADGGEAGEAGRLGECAT